MNYSQNFASKIIFLLDKYNFKLFVKLFIYFFHKYFCIRIAEIECYVVEGYYKYILGTFDKNNRDMYKSSWNIVKLDGFWYFCDPIFGSIENLQKIMKNNSNLNSENMYIILDLNELHFLMDPRIFIFEHFPFESKYQLLARKVNFEEFCQLIL